MMIWHRNNSGSCIVLRILDSSSMFDPMHWNLLVCLSCR